MENSDSSQSVRVAVNIRPLVTTELLVGCTDCISVYPEEKQVIILISYWQWLVSLLVISAQYMDWETCDFWN